MRSSLQAVVATAALALASSVAMSQTVPPQPVAGPTPSPATGSGGLIVSIWDSVRGVSLVQYLGLSLDQILPGGSSMETAGFTLDFGTLANYSTVFGASSATNIQYHVTAADSTGGTFNGRRVATTAALGSEFTITTPRVRDAASAQRDFIELWFNGIGGCNGTNPCIATSSTDGQFAGVDSFGSQLNGQLPVSAAATVGTSLGFYLLSSQNTATQPGLVDRYESALGGLGQWLLNASGQLTYSVGSAVVPLPAAVWLLLSGLLGVATVARRRAASAAV
jgi:hypothetical protein